MARNLTQHSEDVDSVKPIARATDTATEGIPSTFLDIPESMCRKIWNSLTEFLLAALETDEQHYTQEMKLKATVYEENFSFNRPGITIRDLKTYTSQHPYLNVLATIDELLLDPEMFSKNVQQWRSVEKTMCKTQQGMLNTPGPGHAMSIADMDIMPNVSSSNNTKTLESRRLTKWFNTVGDMRNPPPTGLLLQYIAYSVLYPSQLLALF